MSVICTLCLYTRHPVPLILHLSSNSAEVNHSFFLIALARSHRLCSVIFGKPLSFQKARILCLYPLTGLPLSSAEGGHGDLWCCGVAIFFVRCCGDLKPYGVRCFFFYFEAAMFGEKISLRCCDIFFDTFDRLTRTLVVLVRLVELSKPIYIRQTFVCNFLGTKALSNPPNLYLGHQGHQAVNARSFPFSLIGNLTCATRPVRVSPCLVSLCFTAQS